MDAVRYGKILAVAAAVLIAAQFGVIWRLANRERRAGATNVESGSLEEFRTKNKRLQEENARLREELAARIPETVTKPASEATAAMGGGSNPAIERLAVLAEAKKLGAGAQIPAASRARKLDPKFIQLFGLSADEQNALQQAMDAAMKTVDRLEAEHATTQATSDGSVVISVKSYAEEGGAVYDELLSAFAKTLGAERYQAFTALSAESLERDLGEFGTREKTLTVRWNPEAKAYDLREEYRSFQHSGSSSAQLSKFTAIEQRYPGLASLVPAELKDKSASVSR